MKIVADTSLCIGAGQCVMVAPHLFAQGDDDGLVIVRLPDPPERVRGDAEYAVISCPTRALSIEEA